jgi:hypothetical protein
LLHSYVSFTLELGKYFGSIFLPSIFNFFGSQIEHPQLSIFKLSFKNFIFGLDQNRNWSEDKFKAMHRHWLQKWMCEMMQVSYTAHKKCYCFWTCIFSSSPINILSFLYLYLCYLNVVSASTEFLSK